eukprot:scaffold102478_cov63-Phaeocystis_antarctica.AAC.2
MGIPGWVWWVWWGGKHHRARRAALAAVDDEAAERGRPREEAVEDGLEAGVDGRREGQAEPRCDQPEVEREVPHLDPRGHVQLRGVGPGQDAVGEEEDEAVEPPRDERQCAHRLLDDLGGEAQHEQPRGARLERCRLGHVEARHDQARRIGLVHGAAAREGQRLAVVLHVPLHAARVAGVGHLVDAELEGRRQRVRHLVEVRLEGGLAAEGVGVLRVVVLALLGELRDSGRHVALVPRAKVAADGGGRRALGGRRLAGHAERAAAEQRAAAGSHGEAAVSRNAALRHVKRRGRR